MNTRFLETLVVLSRLKSFRETAQVLHTTQAAASQRIAALEDELGVFLVDRSHRTLTLTPVGEQVVRQAERMLALERELKRATQPDAPPAGRVRIGVIETVVHTWLTPLIHGLTPPLPPLDPDTTPHAPLSGGGPGHHRRAGAQPARAVPPAQARPLDPERPGRRSSRQCGTRSDAAVALSDPLDRAARCVAHAGHADAGGPGAHSGADLCAHLQPACACARAVRGPGDGTAHL